MKTLIHIFLLLLSYNSYSYETEDIISDPSDYALPLFGERNNFKIDAVDPSILLNSNTLGLAPKETTLTVRYRYGGGLNHNVNAT